MTRRRFQSEAERRAAKRAADRRYRERKQFADFLCMDCGVCTCCSGDYYMVTDAVWLSVCPDPRSEYSMLCIRCLENRLDRFLTRDDFIDAPINKLAFNSESPALRAAIRRRPGDPGTRDYVYIPATAPDFCEHLPPRRHARSQSPPL